MSLSYSYNVAAATAAKSLQSCLTLCNPIDGSPPGSPVPGILQARTLEWVAISFSNAWKWKVKVKSLSHVQRLQCRRPGFNPRVWKPTPVLLPGESHGQRSLVGYCPWGHKELDTSERYIQELKNWHLLLSEDEPCICCIFFYCGERKIVHLLWEHYLLKNLEPIRTCHTNCYWMNYRN